jgi:tetratricopeptide (TPR) repeat protein
MQVISRIVLIILLIGVYSCKTKNEPEKIPDIVSDLIGHAKNDSDGYDKRLGFAFRADSIAISENDNKEHLKCLILIATLYLQKKEVALSDTYYHKAVIVSRQAHDTLNEAIALNNIGLIFSERTDYDSAIKYFTNAKNIFQFHIRQELYAQCLANLAIAYKNQGNYEEAFGTSMESVKILETFDRKNELATSYMTIGNILKELNRLDEALNYNHKAMAILEKELDSLGIASAFNNIGNIFRIKKEYEKALTNYFTALNIKEKYGNTKTIATTTDNIGQVYFELGKWSIAEDYFKKALDLRSKTNDRDGFLTTSNRLARLYLAKNENNKANNIATKALRMSPKTGYLKLRTENNLLLFEICKKSGKTDLALAYASKGLALKDSLFNEDMAKAISQMNAKYKIEQKEKENVILQNDKIRSEAKIEDQKKKSTIGIISAISIFIISGSIVYAYRKRKIYLFKQEVIALKQEALNAQMSDHFIGNTMDSINNFISNNEKDKASEYLILFSRLIRRVLENAIKKNISLREDMAILRDYLELEALRFPCGSLEWEIDIDNSIDEENTFVPPLIFQVLAENAIKHGFKKTFGGKLKILISQNKDQLLCIVEDNGIGRLAATQNKEGNDKFRTSIGSTLAERLLKMANDSAGASPLSIVDLAGKDNNTKGTKVIFALPLVIME